MNSSPPAGPAGSALDNTETAEAFAADVIEFTAAQNVDSVAKLISFFHLALPTGRTKVDFHLEPGGRMTLRIETDGE